MRAIVGYRALLIIIYPSPLPAQAYARFGRQQSLQGNEHAKTQAPAPRSVSLADAPFSATVSFLFIPHFSSFPSPSSLESRACVAHESCSTFRTLRTHTHHTRRATHIRYPTRSLNTLEVLHKMFASSVLAALVALPFLARTSSLARTEVVLIVATSLSMLLVRWDVMYSSRSGYVSISSLQCYRRAYYASLGLGQLTIPAHVPTPSRSATSATPSLPLTTYPRTFCC